LCGLVDYSFYSCSYSYYYNHHHHYYYGQQLVASIELNMKMDYWLKSAGHRASVENAPVMSYVNKSNCRCYMPAINKKKINKIPKLVFSVIATCQSNVCL